MAEHYHYESAPNFRSTSLPAPSPISPDDRPQLSPEEVHFHKVFPAVPPGEKVVEEYSCSYMKNKILRPGRLYVTALRFCFNAALYSETVNVEWHLVEHLSKKSKMMNMMNMIDIDVAGGTTYSFTAFGYGVSDAAFKLLNTMWSVRTHYGPLAAQSGRGSAPLLPPLPKPRPSPSTSPTIAPMPKPSQQPEVITHHRTLSTEDNVHRAAEDPLSGSIIVQHTVSPAAPPPPTAISDQPPPPAPPADQQPSPAPQTDGPPSSQCFSSAPNFSIAQPALEMSVDDAPKSMLPGKNVSLEASFLPAHPMPAPASASTPPPQTPPLDPHPTRTSPEKREGSVVADTETDSVIPAKKLPRPDHVREMSDVEEAHQKHQRQQIRASNEVLRNFPKVPTTDHLIDNFQCSYVRGMHRIGKMYITANYILFSSPMYSEVVQLSFLDITKVERSSTMMILEGIKFTMKHGLVYEFTSFLSREAAFSIVTQLHQTHKRSREVLAKVTAELASSVDPNEDREEDVGLPAAIDERPPFKTKTASPMRLSEFPEMSSLTDGDRYVTDWGDVFSSIERLLETRIIDSEPMPEGFDINDLFRFLLDDGAKFLEQYHIEHGDRDVHFEPWRPCVGVPPCSGQRILTSTTPIKALFSTTMCPWLEYERFWFANINGIPTVALHVSGQASGVMYTDTFRAETIFVWAQPLRDIPRCTLTISAHIQFVKSVIIRGKIRSTALEKEMPVEYRKLTALCKRFLLTKSAMAVGAKRMKSLAEVPPESPPEVLVPIALTAAVTDSAAGGVANSSELLSLLCQRTTLLRVATCVSAFFSFRSLLAVQRVPLSSEVQCPALGEPAAVDAQLFILRQLGESVLVILLVLHLFFFLKVC